MRLQVSLSVSTDARLDCGRIRVRAAAERRTTMNGELKPGAVSSGFAQRNDRPGNHPGFATEGGLNEFLIRRQLLGMESRRIKEVLAEADAELKNRQDRLIGVRDGTYAGLRNHLDRLEEQAREQQARVGGLKNLPRTAERYIRRSVKRLLAPPEGDLHRNHGWDRLEFAEGPGTLRLDALVCRERSINAQAVALSKGSDSGRLGRERRDRRPLGVHSPCWARLGSFLLRCDRCRGPS